MPSPALRAYIQCYWLIHRDATLYSYREEFLHPDGGAGITFNVGDNLLMGENTIRQTYFLEVASTATRSLGLQGHIEAIGVRFKPGGVFPFLSTPLYELANDIILLDDLGLTRAQSVYQQICQAGSLAEKIAHVEMWLISRLRNSRVVSSIVGTSLDMMRKKKGQLSIKEVADRMYVSQRQLERLYKVQVGMSPKKYARMLRVAHARNMLKQHTKGGRATDVGLVTGFYDQPHFIREFKSVVGLTPKNYIKRSFARTVSSPHAHF